MRRPIIFFGGLSEHGLGGSVDLTQAQVGIQKEQAHGRRVEEDLQGLLAVAQGHLLARHLLRQVGVDLEETEGGMGRIRHLLDAVHERLHETPEAGILAAELRQFVRDDGVS